MADSDVELLSFIDGLMEHKDYKSARAVFECQKYKTLEEKKDILATFLGLFDALSCFIPGPRRDACKDILGQLKKTGDTRNKRNCNWNVKYSVERLSLLLLLFDMEEAEKKKAARGVRESARSELYRAFYSLRKNISLFLAITRQIKVSKKPKERRRRP